MWSQQAGFSAAEEEAVGRRTGSSEALLIELAHASRLGLIKIQSLALIPLAGAATRRRARKRWKAPCQHRSTFPSLLHRDEGVWERAKTTLTFEVARGSQSRASFLPNGDFRQSLFPENAQENLSRHSSPRAHSQHHWTASFARRRLDHPSLANCCSATTAASLDNPSVALTLTLTLTLAHLQHCLPATWSPSCPVPHINTVPTRVSTRQPINTSTHQHDRCRSQTVHPEPRPSTIDC